MSNDISTAELARQVQEVLLRFQSLADRLDTSYVTKELFDLYRRSMETSLKVVQDNCAAVEKDKAEKSSHQDALRRIANLEDNQKWLVRLVLGLIVVAIVGLVIVSGNAK